MTGCKLLKWTDRMPFMPVLLLIFNKIAIQEIAADKEAVGLSRVHMYESKCSLPLRDNCL